MAYCTIDDITKLIPGEAVMQLTDDDNLGQVNQAMVDEAIAQADAEIDSYCADRYSVPFVSAPAIIRKCSVDIAIYNLYSRRVEEMPEARAERYKNAVRQLEGIAKGLMSLGQAAATAGEGGAETNMAETGRVFTRETLKGY